MYDKDLVSALRDLPIDVSEKGFGGRLHRGPVTSASLAAAAPHAGAGWLGSPRAMLRDSALRHNIATMAAYCDDHGTALYPHAKTTMAPQLVAMQLDAGAQGVTVATVAQARLLHGFGVRELLVANQVTDEAGVAWLGRALSDDPALAVTCYVDSTSGVELLDGAMSRAGSTRRLDVLVELGHDGGRTGVRTRTAARQVADAVARSSRLSLVGVAGYEGALVRPTPDQTAAAARAFCEELGALAGELLASGNLSSTPIVTAGGSAYFDAVVDVLAGEPAWRLVLRSGCYLTHDHGLYAAISAFERIERMPQLRPALEVWAPVLSRPERGTVVVGAGRRDVSSDAGLPVLLRGQSGPDRVDVSGSSVRRMFDQHLVVRVPDDCALAPGDEVALGISHPCTTFDKWRWLPVIDDDDRLIDVVRTLF